MVELFIHRCFSEDARAICSCLCYSLLGHIYRLYFTIQYYNEVGFLGKLFVNCVVHEASQNCSEILWQRPRYFPSCSPCGSLPCIGSCYTWKVYLQGGNVDLLHILGSCRYPSSACLVAENKKHRQFDWTIHFTLGRISVTLHLELGIPLLHRTTLCTLDNLDCRPHSDVALCWFLLLLLPKLEE